MRRMTAALLTRVAEQLITLAQALDPLPPDPLLWPDHAEGTLVTSAEDFVRAFGPPVNFSRIPPEDAIPLQVVDVRWDDGDLVITCDTPGPDPIRSEVRHRATWLSDGVFTERHGCICPISPTGDRVVRPECPVHGGDKP